MLKIGWTTVETSETAHALARNAVETKLIVCAQVDSPITSYYRWDGEIQTTKEFRLTFKFLPSHQERLEAWLHSRHPYDTPEWIVMNADSVAEKYLSWAKANSSSLSL